MADKIQELREFVRSVDRELQREFPFTVDSVRVSGNPDKPNTYYVRGHAAVFNSWSLDLGGFRERLQPGAFDNVLATDPHVLHVWDHDTSKVLSSTRNGTLKLAADESALHYDSEVAPTSYAADLRILLERGDIDQSSFAFSIPTDGEEWRIVEEDGRDIIERTVRNVDGLYDVTTCAMGAYPASTAALAVRTMLNPKIRGRFPESSRVVLAADTTFTGGAALVAPVVGETKEVAPQGVGTPRASNEDAADRRAEVTKLKRESELALHDARERLFRRRQP